MNEKFVINIGREFGSGGVIIAEKLSQKLGINYYNKKLIDLSANKSGLGKEYFEKSEENPVMAGFFGDFSGLPANIFSAGYYGENLLINKSLFKIQSDIIKQLAGKESCIFVGRCADYVLRDHPRAVNVFVCDDIDIRTKRKMNERKKKNDFEKIKKEIEKTDKNRAKYYNFYTNKTWGAAASYHLCVNVSALGLDESAGFIYNFAVKKLGLK